MNMGFDYEACYVATQKYPNNPDRACNAILENADSLRSEYVPFEPVLPGDETPVAGERKPNKRTGSKPPYKKRESTTIPFSNLLKLARRKSKGC